MFLGTTTELFRFCGLRPAFFRLLKRAFVPKFAIPFVHARNSRVGASNHKHSLLDKHPFKKEKHVGWFPFLQRACSCRGPFSKEFRRGELDGREPFPFPLGSRFFSGSCFIPHLTIRVYLLLSMCGFSTVSFSYALRPALRCSSARGGLFQVVFHEKRNASHEFPVPGFGPPFSGEQYLECTATAMALAALTVEADENVHYPEFPSRAASASRLWFHPIAC